MTNYCLDPRRFGREIEQASARASARPVLGMAFLAYAHHRVWILKTGHRTGKIVLVVNTVLVVLLWAWRLPF